VLPLYFIINYYFIIINNFLSFPLSLPCGFAYCIPLQNTRCKTSLFLKYQKLFNFFLRGFYSNKRRNKLFYFYHFFIILIYLDAFCVWKLCSVQFLFCFGTPPRRLHALHVSARLDLFHFNRFPDCQSDTRFVLLHFAFLMLLLLNAKSFLCLIFCTRYSRYETSILYLKNEYTWIILDSTELSWKKSSIATHIRIILESLNVLNHLLYNALYNKPCMNVDHPA